MEIGHFDGRISFQSGDWHWFGFRRVWWFGCLSVHFDCHFFLLRAALATGIPTSFYCELSIATIHLRCERCSEGEGSAPGYLLVFTCNRESTCWRGPISAGLSLILDIGHVNERRESGYEDMHHSCESQRWGGKVFAERFTG